MAPSATDALIDHYAALLQGVYENRTAGDHTFSGVLTTFLLDVESARAQEAPAKAPESPAEPRYRVQRFIVRSSDDLGQYTVQRTLDRERDTVRWACSCPAYRYSKERETKGCKHIDQVRAREESAWYSSCPVNYEFETDNPDELALS